MVTVITTNDMSLNKYDYYYEWHQVKWLQLLVWMVSDYIVTVITTNGTRLDG